MGAPVADAVGASELEDPEEEVVAPSAQGQEERVEAKEERIEAKASDIFTLIRQQNFPIALKLLEAYPQHWSAGDEDGHSLLHWGALVGNKDFVLKALATGVPVDVQAANKQTPLMWAVLRGQISTVRILLDAKASLLAHDSLGATALMIAVQHKQHSSMLLLMNRGKDQRDALLGGTDKNGCTSAHWAAYKGDLTFLKLLDYFGADLMALDNSKMQPLHRAVHASQGAVVEFLVEKMADPNARNADGQSCLDIAEHNQDASMQMIFKRIMAKQSKSAAGKSDIEAGLVAPMDVSSGRKEPKESMCRSLMKDQALHIAFPIFWLVCVSLAVFEYLVDLRSASWTVGPRASFCFEVGVPLSLALFAYVALMDPGKVPPKARGNTGVEELMRAIDGGMQEEHVPDVSRLCLTTWVLKDLRTKYCAQTGACVQEFDHYCIWLNCAIGKRNHRPFVGLAIAEFCTEVSHLILCFFMALELVPYESFGSWAMNVILGYPMLVLMFFAHCLFAPWVFMLIVHQCRLVAMNMTTNEMMNVHRYSHFWVVTAVGPGRVQKAYRNPFNKGNWRKNCLDFWWRLERSKAVALNEVPPPSLSSCGPACSNHGHGHVNGHSHAHDV